jgi:hypothetical protein
VQLKQKSDRDVQERNERAKGVFGIKALEARKTGKRPERLNK